MELIASQQQLVQQLLTEVPCLRALYEEHLRDYNELLPHVFMGSVVRFVVSEVEGGTPPLEHAAVGQILGVIEAALASLSPEVSELASVSFAENLAEHRDVVRKLKADLGPRLRQEIETYS